MIRLATLDSGRVYMVEIGKGPTYHRALSVDAAILAARHYLFAYDVQNVPRVEVLNEETDTWEIP